MFILCFTCNIYYHLTMNVYVHIKHTTVYNHNANSVLKDKQPY